MILKSRMILASKSLKYDFHTASAAEPTLNHVSTLAKLHLFMLFVEFYHFPFSPNTESTCISLAA